jgi:glycosyltransferase involved in cell wall biosynthesis
MKQLANFSYKALFRKELLTNYYERLFLIDKYKKVNNRFIAISEDTNAYFKRVLPESLRKNIRLLKNAINTGRFARVNHQRDLDKIRIVNVGAFRDVKNQKFLVDIAEELLRRGAKFEITMLGYGPFYDQVKQKVESKGLQHVISMPANVVNVEDYYRDANIYVHVATVEPFGLVFLEAMSAGLPVIALDGGGNRDLIKDGENGFMIYKQDASEFADKIMLLYSDKSLYSQMAGNGAAFAKSYDIGPYVDRLIELYKQA